MLADYDELKAAIADFLLRDDLTAVVPTFVRLAEARMDRELRHYRQEKRSALAVTGQYTDLPADYLQTIRLQITDGPTSEVAPVSTAQMMQMREDRNDRAGRPTHYAITAGSIELFPTPDAEYAASLVYHGRITALSDAAPVNWLLTEAPDAYLYGALLHSAPYLKDDNRVALWEGLYKVAMENLMISSADAKWAGAGLRIKTRRGAP